MTLHELNDKDETPTDSIFDMSMDPILARPSTPSILPLTRIPLPVNKVNSSLAKTVTMTRDTLHKAIGFRSITTLLKHMNTLGNKSLQIQNLPQIESIDEGEVALLNSSRRNTTPVEPPSEYGTIFHTMDIGYGLCTAIGGIKYSLLIVDKSCRYKFIYGLKNLTTSLLAAMKKFI